MKNIIIGLLLSISTALFYFLGLADGKKPQTPVTPLPNMIKVLEDRGNIVVAEFTDPANGERFLIVTTGRGVAIAKASPPLVKPE